MSYFCLVKGFRPKQPAQCKFYFVFSQIPTSRRHRQFPIHPILVGIENWRSLAVYTIDQYSFQILISEGNIVVGSNLRGNICGWMAYPYLVEAAQKRRHEVERLLRKLTAKLRFANCTTDKLRL